jgi:general secretion pathway protein G
MSAEARLGRRRRRAQVGMTLLELIIACSILMVLASAALPVARYSIRRHQESELRIVLRETRNAIDRYKDTADRNLIQVELGTEGYPPDLETLVRGVELAGVQGRRVRFLRRIPIDPMTGRAEWGMRCVQDEPNARGWCGSNVFDVYSLSIGTGLDGRPYADW